MAVGWGRRGFLMRLFRCAAIPLMLACSLVATLACTSSSSTTTTSAPASTTVATTTSATPPPPTSTTPAQTTPVKSFTINVSSGNATLGNYLVDANGMTLYWTTLDASGQSNVTGTVLANWPVFYAASVVVPSSLATSDFGSITRSDGTKQTTYKGWPLYYFIKDKNPGDASGQGIGGVWFVVSPTATGPAKPTTTP